MRGLISSEEPGILGVASALRQAIPAVYQEDPLFMELCAAVDDLLAPLVTAVDCFDTYLDPYLAPADFLPWLAELVGYQGSSGRDAHGEREQIAAAVRDHARRGTPLGVREAAARAAGVPVEQVELDDPGGTRWSALPGGVRGDWPQVTACVRVPAPSAARGLEAVRDAVDAVAAAHCPIAVEVVRAEDAPQPRRPRPPGPSRQHGARTYGGES